MLNTAGLKTLKSQLKKKKPSTCLTTCKWFSADCWSSWSSLCDLICQSTNQPIKCLKLIISNFTRSSVWLAICLWATWPPTSWTSSSWWLARAQPTSQIRTRSREPWPIPWRKFSRLCFSGFQEFGRRSRRKWWPLVSYGLFKLWTLN